MPSSLRHVAWLACACLLLCGNLAAASELHVGGDLDGDGQRDRVTLDRTHPYILNVWLSSSQTTWTVRSRTPIVRVALSDLDGDNRPELITRGKEPGLTVWTRKKHQGFKRYHPRRTELPSIARTAPHAIHHHGESDSSGAPSGGSSSLGMLIASRPRAPALIGVHAVDSLLVDACRAVVLAVFAPRPPPAFA
ncbi:MAG: VCBS repeat-containing protein [Vicinamibacterales bacterium]